MKEVLLVAYYFPPVATSGAMRPLAFSRHLGEHGWKVSVISTDPASVFPRLEEDTALAQQIPSDVEVIRVPHRSVMLTKKGNNELLAIGKRVKADQPYLQMLGKIKDLSKEHLRPLGQFVASHLIDFPDQQRSWLRPAVQAACEFAQRRRPNVVLATGGPWTSLLVGLAVSRNLAVPLVADFRDPWRHNPVQRGKSLFKWRVRRAEEYICDASKKIIANTSALHKQFILDYPYLFERIETITNGFDKELMKISVSPIQENQPQQSVKPLELVHFGSIYGKRNPSNLLKAISEMHRDRGISSKVCIRFVGPWDIKDVRCNEMVEELERSDLVIREAPIPHAMCLERMRDAAILLVLQGSSPLQIPGKMYEYIASGRPILLIGGEGATAQLVADHQLGLQCGDDTQSIKSLLNSLLNGTNELLEPAVESIRQFDYQSLTARLAEVLDESIF